MRVIVRCSIIGAVFMFGVVFPCFAISAAVCLTHPDGNQTGSANTMTRSGKKPLKLAFYKTCAGAALVTSVFGGVAQARSVDFDSYDERMDRIAIALKDLSVSPRELVGMGYSRNNAYEVPECREELAGTNPSAAEIHRCTNMAREHRFVMAYLSSIVLTAAFVTGLAYSGKRTLEREEQRKRGEQEKRRQQHQRTNMPGPK